MPPLPKTIPRKTTAVKSFVVYLANGEAIQVSINGGEGFFREEVFVGAEKSFSTHQVFIANGRSRILPVFGSENGGEMSTESEETPESEEEEAAEETEEETTTEDE